MKSTIVAIEGAARALVVATAASMRERSRGLLGRAPLAHHEAMLLRPCRLVHTFGMGYAIDLVFLDRAGTVRRVDEAVPRARVRGCAKAWQTLELAAGAARAHGLRVGTTVPAFDWSRR